MERSHFFSPCRVKKQPGISPILRWYLTHSQQSPLRSQGYVQMQSSAFRFWFGHSAICSPFARRESARLFPRVLCSARSFLKHFPHERKALAVVRHDRGTMFSLTLFRHV